MHAAGEPEVKWWKGPARPWAVLLRSWQRRIAALRRPTRVELDDWIAGEFETEAKARSSFFLIPIGLMIGVAIVDGAGLRMGIAPALALTASLLAAAHRLGGRGLWGTFMLVSAFAALGMSLAIAELRWTATTIFSGEATVRIEGRVTWRDRDDRDRMRYLVRIEKTERPVLSRPPEVATILVSSRHETIPVGGRFAGLVRLRAPSGPAYPGAYDFAFAPFFEGRGANGFALGPPDAPEPETVTPTLGERLVRLRLAMSDRIREVIGGGAGAVASALITGERSGIPDNIDHWLRATGLSHVLSISGLHMALVAGFAMLLVRGLLASIPGAALMLPTKKIAAVAALLVATAYLVISGSDVATDRSYVMLSIMLVAILVDRPALTLRNVAIAAIVVIVTTPHAVVTASFQMSFSATAALVGVYGAFSKNRARRAGGGGGRHPAFAILLFLGGLAASSAIAGAATAPYAAYHFQRIAPYGVIANLVALPIFSFWIMPLALIAALAMPFGLDAPFLILIGWGLDIVFAMAKTLAEHLPDAPSGRLTTTGLLVVTAALLLACLPASRLRWSALPVALAGLWLLPDRGAPPDLLVYEDGRELAIIDPSGHLQSLRRRPNDFVFDQWKRAYEGDAPAAAAPQFPIGSKSASDARVTSSDTWTQVSPGKPAGAAAVGTTETERLATTATDTASSGPSAPNLISTAAPSAFACEPSPMPEETDASPTQTTASRPSTTDRNAEPSEIALGPQALAGGTPTVDQTVGRALDADADPRTRGLSTAQTELATPSATKSPIASVGSTSSSIAPRVRKPKPPRQICRAVLRSGLRIAWTDDHRLLGLVCDTADIAIVARAVARRECRSGARLVTLRTLRQTGSLAISRASESGRAILAVSITDPTEPWNLHRLAPWPEFWRNPDGAATPRYSAIGRAFQRALNRPKASRHRSMASRLAHRAGYRTQLPDSFGPVPSALACGRSPTPTLSNASTSN